MAVEYVKKCLPFFFCREDENLFESELKRQIPTICFVDGSRWETTHPPAKAAFSECRSGIVFLWDMSACPKLPFQSLEGGRARGPTSGVVIQYVRSMLSVGVLTSGDMGIGYKRDDLAIAQFVETTWQVARSMNSGTLSSVDKKTGRPLESGIADYIVGPNSKSLSKEGTLLKHCAVEVYYRVD
jgi:hypothetical protein